MVNEDYKSFVQITRKNGIYVDKRSNYMVKVTEQEILTKSRDGRSWDRHVASISNPNKKRFLSYSKRQGIKK